MYDAALLTRCYTQHALRPFIDSESNHIRHFIKIPFINKGIDFIAGELKCEKCLDNVNGDLSVKVTF